MRKRQKKKRIRRLIAQAEAEVLRLAKRSYQSWHLAYHYGDIDWRWPPSTQRPCAGNPEAEELR